MGGKSAEMDAKLKEIFEGCKDKIAAGTLATALVLAGEGCDYVGAMTFKSYKQLQTYKDETHEEWIKQLGDLMDGTENEFAPAVKGVLEGYDAKKFGLVGTPGLVCEEKQAFGFMAFESMEQFEAYRAMDEYKAMVEKLTSVCDVSKGKNLFGKIMFSVCEA